MPRFVVRSTERLAVREPVGSLRCSVAIGVRRGGRRPIHRHQRPVGAVLDLLAEILRKQRLSCSAWSTARRRWRNLTCWSQ